MNILGISEWIYSVYKSLFFRVLVVSGCLLALYNITAAPEILYTTRVYPYLVMIAITITYFIGTQSKSTSLYWRYSLMWTVLLSQILLGIYANNN